MEVLSVVSVQVKSVLDAIKSKKKKFDFMGEFITLIPTVGMFITMNPGYAGRTELPENLKALFRYIIIPKVPSSLFYVKTIQSFYLLLSSSAFSMHCFYKASPGASHKILSSVRVLPLFLLQCNTNKIQKTLYFGSKKSVCLVCWVKTLVPCKSLVHTSNFFLLLYVKPRSTSAGHAPWWCQTSS